MKKIIMSVLAIFLPWLALLLNDNPGGAFVALIMQATVIGWPFASMWAWKSVRPERKTQHKKSKPSGE